VERDILRAIVKRYVEQNDGHVDYLDFACGTGRVVSALEDLVSTSSAIDISRQMIDIARAKTDKTVYYCKDISLADDVIENKYDIITCFRFLTNAEDALRREVLVGLKQRLKGGGSVLIINGHGNPLSYRLVTLPYHWLRDRLEGRPLRGYLSTWRIRRLLASAGLRVERRVGMGFVPEKLHGWLSDRIVLFVERALPKVWGLGYFGLNQVFVCVSAEAPGCAGMRPPQGCDRGQP
jgi:2-polyprenyl-3-methyl-5-hydroxy-6-metoxy-1,4-benzoquinol methylase